MLISRRGFLKLIGAAIAAGAADDRDAEREGERPGGGLIAGGSRSTVGLGTDLSGGT